MISIIFFCDYYSTYLFPHIISIITIITLLCALFLSQTIITIIVFEMYYVDYLFSCLLFQLWPLSHYYLHYVCVWLLSQLWLSNSIKCIILFPKHYLRYCNYAIKIIAIIRISDIIAIMFIWSLLRAKVVYGYRYCP